MQNREARTVEIYIFISFVLFLTVNLIHARMEMEYCKVAGITIPFDRVFWSQVTCRQVYLKP